MNKLAATALKAVIGFDDLPIKAKIHGTKYHPDWKIFTFEPNSKGDDSKMFLDPRMRTNCPRGFGALLDVKQNKLITSWAGPKKFEGVTQGDDDDSSIVSVPVETIHQWNKDGELQVIREDKENGKFALVKFFLHEDEWFAVFGSKNGHRIARRNDIREYIEDANETIIIKQVAAEVERHWDNLLSFFEVHPESTLVGELCDGLHFVPMETNEPVVKFFGSFVNNGNAVDPIATFAEFSRHGIPSVSWSIMEIGSPDWYNKCIASARCGSGEGSVLYFRNRRTGEVHLAKNKSAVYILKRVARELIKQPYNNKNGKKGYHAIFADFANRVVDRSSYHMLCTDKCVEIVKYMYSFTEWMMENRIPTDALNFTPVSSDVIGELGEVGFANVWARFLRETGQEEIEVTPDDIGDFDKDDLLSRVAMLRSFERSERPFVVFFQGAQGCGKSTIGAATVKHLEKLGYLGKIVEQDQFYGKAGSCQSYMKHLVEQRPDVDFILVTRCNANRQHYSAYLKKALEGNARVVFIAPRGIESAEGLAMCLDGVKQRSKNGDKLLIGRIEKDAKTANDIVRKTHASLEIHDKAIRFNRTTIDETAAHICDILMEVCDNPVHPAIVHRVDEDSRPLLVSLRLSKESDSIVREIAGQHGITCKSEMHLTQVFDAKGKNKSFELAPEGSEHSVEITHLVIRKSDGQAAFRVTTGLQIHSGCPHITVRVGEGSSARQSLQFVDSNDDDLVTVIHIYKRRIHGRIVYSD